MAETTSILTPNNENKVQDETEGEQELNYVIWSEKNVGVGYDKRLRLEVKTEYLYFVGNTGLILGMEERQDKIDDIFVHYTPEATIEPSRDKALQYSEIFLAALSELIIFLDSTGDGNKLLEKIGKFGTIHGLTNETFYSLIERVVGAENLVIINEDATNGKNNSKSIEFKFINLESILKNNTIINLGQRSKKRLERNNTKISGDTYFDGVVNKWENSKK